MCESRLLLLDDALHRLRGSSLCSALSASSQVGCAVSEDVDSARLRGTSDATYAAQPITQFVTQDRGGVAPARLGGACSLEQTVGEPGVVKALFQCAKVN